MKHLLSFLLPIFLLVGCGEGAAPAPLAIEEAPAALRKAFTSASSELQSLIKGIAMQIEKKQYAPAAFQIQNLLEDRSLNKEQRSLLSRALVAVNSKVQQLMEMQEAAVSVAPQSGGAMAPAPRLADPDAQTDSQAAAEARATMHIYRRTK